MVIGVSDVFWLSLGSAAALMFLLLARTEHRRLLYYCAVAAAVVVVTGLIDRLLGAYLGEWYRHVTLVRQVAVAGIDTSAGATIVILVLVDWRLKRRRTPPSSNYGPVTK